MPAPFFIPPWLTQGADPTEAYVRGAQLGLAQNQQALQERAQIRAEQVAAQEQARYQAELGLRQAAQEMEVQETARRVQGQLRYRELVASGVDPLQAMLQTPEVWGASLPNVAAAQRAYQQRLMESSFQPSVEKIGGAEFARLSPTRWERIRAPGNVAEPVIDRTTGKQIGWNWNDQFHALQREPDLEFRRENRELASLRSAASLLRKQLAMYLQPIVGERMLAKAPAADKVKLKRLRDIEARIAEITGSEELMPETEPAAATAPTASTQSAAQRLGLVSMQRRD